jgi:hypothetical protein
MGIGGSVVRGGGGREKKSIRFKILWGGGANFPPGLLSNTGILLETVNHEKESNFEIKNLKGDLKEIVAYS